jgi:hypothetical protein
MGGDDARLLFVGRCGRCPVAGLVFVVVTTNVTLFARLLHVARSPSDR